ncbi:DEAD/DEAH box helicase family protein [Patescibacteria group bacterium]|nr:DEAD/DEAH box helicase family protein [Patescibacteria group bacterium]MBU4016409.1 DEAD/DEAH box helicase family protein [Patescibacteria group bacterium]MBU4098899.1 DEAD/DEAH box helicase family protein [Patescibacteria group bacterium]
MSYITNSGENNLKNRLVGLISKSEELKFLVGFFYFSGIKELYEGLRKNSNTNIKVLVGLNVDKTNFGLLEFADQDSQLSDEDKTYSFFQSIKKSLNTENFDTKEFYEQVRFFIQLIRDDKLIIRKTFKPNHAKLYILKLEESQVGRKNLFITGSSNLTKSGLTTQEEFNVEISDFGVKDAEEYFDGLWDEAVKITEHEETKRKLIAIVEKETLIKEITPFEAFVLVLKTYLDSFEGREVGPTLVKILEENGYTPYKYQLDAVAQALLFIENNNGVIIADVVGLGKTIIACSVAKELKKRGIVICPPGIMGDKNKNSGWKKYLEEFKLYDWEVRSLGDLENITDFVVKYKDIEVVIIDEAHRFRNQDTRDYELLKNICRNKIVILLTATPFNNRPGDILSLLKLFITPKKSSITLENNLVDKFKAFKGTFDRLGYISKYWNSPNSAKRKKAEGYYQSFFESKIIELAKVKQRAHYLARQIRDVIKPVTIRRNRLDLQNNPYYKDEVKNLSKVADPKEWFFELTKEQSEFYDKVILEYFGDPDEGGQFKGAIYRPFEYEIERKKIANELLTEKENFQYYQQRNLYDFMRRLLVKRFESSFGSFEQSIKNFKHITETVLKFVEKTNKYILDRSLVEKICDENLEEIEKYLAEYTEKINNGEYPKNHKVYDLNKNFNDKDGFIANIKTDLILFDNILRELSTLDLVKNDPKTECLLNNIIKEIKQKPLEGEPKRKIIIFSEYLDTVKYLEAILKKHFKERLLISDSDLSAQKILQINKNFDASYPDQDDDFDVLLASDKISEGFNLNRAGMVVNYDIPWNPVRVIQRVGRINRISKKVFNELYIVNFFPTEKGAELVKSREIASNKMFLIHKTLGEDAKIFDIDEEPTPSGLYNRIQQNPDEREGESFYNKALKAFLKIKKDSPDLIESLKNYPPRIKVAKKYTENELLVFLKKGRLYIHCIRYGSENGSEVYQADFEEIFGKIACTQDEKAIPLSGSFWEAYESVRKFKEHKVVPLSEQSLEQRALNNLATFINKIQSDGIMPYKDFLRTLREDILDYGTLSDFTLRRVANMESKDEARLKKAMAEIILLRNELGEDYLEKEKARRKDLSKEIIIAIENQMEAK